MARSRTRTLSQNFLVHRATAARIAALADPRPDGLLVEIGAGRGILTAALADRCPQGRIVAHEIDPRLVRELRAGAGRRPNVRIAAGDFLTAHPPHRPFAAAGNIPYARTAAIVDWCLTARHLTAATLVTQLEYARKRTGGYGRWSRLTVRTWPAVEWRLLQRIPRGEFHPVPRIDSAVLRLDRRPRPLLPPSELPAYRALVDLGFTGVGGSLHASLRRAHPRRRVDAAFRAAGLPQRALVGEVPPAAWLHLFDTLSG